MNMIKQNDNTLGTNTTYDQSPAAVQMRLDTSSLMEKIELFLRGGGNVSRYNNENEIETSFVKTGSRMCNDLGVQTLLNWIGGTLNPHVVQGNFLVDPKTGTSKAYDVFIENYNIDLASLVVINLYDWEMDVKNAEGVIDFVMNMIIPFMTRLIDNKERESYGNTIRTVESNSITQGKSNPFGLGGRN